MAKVNFVDEFKKLWKNERPDPGVGVGLMTWASGRRANIENMQKCNMHLKWIDRNVYISELALLNNVRNFLKSPSVKKQDDKLDFFYEDVCSYFNWTRRELERVYDLLDWDSLKVDIADKYGYDKKQRRKLNI